MVINKKIRTYLGDNDWSENRGTRRGCRAVFWGPCGPGGHLIPSSASVATTVSTLPLCIPNSLFTPFLISLFSFAAMASSPQQSSDSASASSQASAETEKSHTSQPSKVVEPDQYWLKSTTTMKNLKKLRERGLLPDPQIYEWKATKGEDHPTPDTHQVAVFIAHFQCGFGVYPSKFLEWVYRHETVSNGPTQKQDTF